MSGLAAGVYTVQANKPGYAQGTATVPVAADETAELDIRLVSLQ